MEVQQFYFKKFQYQLLFLVNQKRIRERLGISLDIPKIELFGINNYHFAVGKDTYQVNILSGVPFSQAFLKALVYLDSLIMDGKILTFDDSIEALLFGLQIHNPKIWAGLTNFIFPTYLYTSTGDITADSGGDGLVYKEAANWAASRDATTGTTDAAGAAVNVHSGDFGGGTWSVGRLFTPFANPSIPTGARIVSADYKLTPSSAFNDGAASHTYHACQTAQASLTSLAAGDYDSITGLTGSITSGGSDDFSGANDAQVTIELNATGLTWITAGADIKLGLVTANDQSNTTTGAGVYTRRSIHTANAATAGYKPMLNVTYTIPGGFFGMM